MMYNSQPTNPVVTDDQLKDEEPVLRTLLGAKLTDKPDNSFKTTLAEIFVQVINFRDCSTRFTWWMSTIVFGFGELLFATFTIDARPGTAWISIIPMIYLGLSWLAVSKRRLEDAGYNAGWMCLQCVSLICIIHNVRVRCQIEWSTSISDRLSIMASNASTIYYMAILALIVNVIILVVFGGTKSKTYTYPEPRYISYH